MSTMLSTLTIAQNNKGLQGSYVTSQVESFDVLEKVTIYDHGSDKYTVRPFFKYSPICLPH